MNIVYLIEDFSVKGGAERIISEKAETLASAYGHDITIVSIFHDERPPAYPLHRTKLVSLKVPFAIKKGGIIRKTLSRTRVLTQASVRFNRLMDDIQPDVIFFTLGLGALLLPLYRGKAKRVYESHLARQFTAYHRLFAPMEHMADIIVCLTTGDAAQYNRARHVKVIPNFIEKPVRHVENHAVKKAVAVGRLERQKGFDILINCWKNTIKDFTDWQLDIYGEGPLREELQRQIDFLSLSGSVTLQGVCKDMNEKYADYSLHLMTSRYEGQGIVLIEAQAAGLPSVTFDYEYGARDIVINNVTGIITPQGDEQEFTSAMRKMMDSEELRRKYGTKAMKAADRFSRDEVMKLWNGLLSEL